MRVLMYALVSRENATPLAVTALVLLTGKEPQSLYDSYQGIWLWGKEIKVSHQLEAVLKKMLAYQPNGRYQRADQVLKQLPSQLATHHL